MIGSVEGMGAVAAAAVVVVVVEKEEEADNLAAADRLEAGNSAAVVDRVVVVGILGSFEVGRFAAVEDTAVVVGRLHAVAAAVVRREAVFVDMHVARCCEQR